MYTIKNTETNNEKASDYETFSLLYLLGIRRDNEDIDIVLIDCFNDVTGADENVSQLWDVQSKGYKKNTPLKIGENLVTLYANFLSDFPFSHLILFFETVNSIHVTDDKKQVFKLQNFTNNSKKKIFQGLEKEVERRRKSALFESSTKLKMDEFLDKVDFVICTKDKVSNVKNLIKFENLERHADELFLDMFKEIRDMQSSLKNINAENQRLTTPRDVLLLKKYISRNQIITLVINRLVGIKLFNNLSVPINFSSYINSKSTEEIKDMVQDCNSSLCRTFFDKNNKVHVWRLLEFTIKQIVGNASRNVEGLFILIPEGLRKKVKTLDDTSMKFFIARVKDGLA